MSACACQPTSNGPLSANPIEFERYRSAWDRPVNGSERGIEEMREILPLSE
jgi:hypothetical protein